MHLSNQTATAVVVLASIFGGGEEFPKLLIICQNIELNILLTHNTQYQVNVNGTYNIVDVALHTLLACLLNRAGTAVVVVGKIFSRKPLRTLFDV